MQCYFSAFFKDTALLKVHSEYPPLFIYLFTAVGDHMHTLFRVLFLSCTAAQLFPLFPLCTPSRAISQITCILLWKIHDIWRCNIMGKQWKPLHMMPVPPVLAEQKKLRSHPTNYWTLVMLRLKQIQAAIDHLRKNSISNMYILWRQFLIKDCWLWNSSIINLDVCKVASVSLLFGVSLLFCFVLLLIRIVLPWFSLGSSIHLLSKQGGRVIHNPHPS